MAFAFVFPGQGSQSLKMMDEFLKYNIVNETFATARDVLGCDFLAMLQEKDASNINQTINTQPLILTAGYAMYLNWLTNGGKKPQIMAGHSLGEWTALVASGVIDFKDALKLVRLRAEEMQDAVKPDEGAMAVVFGLDDETVINVCQEIEAVSGNVVAGVNFNSPGQVVITGIKTAVEQAIIALKEKGARKIQPLAVSVPSHCSLMLPASIKLSEALKSVHFSAAQIPVLHNFNVESYTNATLIKEALIKQLYMPVLWSKSIRMLVARGITQVAECGPGKVLSGLNKRIDVNLLSYTLSNPADAKKAMMELN